MAELTKLTRFGRREDLDKGRKWYIVDVKGKPLGRVASRIAHLLKGKHKPTYDTHLDQGDHVVVLNAAKVKLTGKKLALKTTFSFSGYHGGHRIMAYKDLMQTDPEQAITLAVKGMLPKNSLGKAMIKKMKVYRDEKHPHSAQKAEPVPPLLFGKL